MALIYKDNAPVKFISGTYTGFNELSTICNCLSHPFMQLAEKGDDLEFQIGLGAYGTELVDNGAFDAVGNWVVNNWVIGSGVATHTGTTQALTQEIDIIEGRFYRVSVDLVSIGQNNTLEIRFGGNVIAVFNNIGTNVFWVNEASFTTQQIMFTSPTTPLSAVIDNVSVIEYSQAGYEIKDCDGTTSHFSDFDNDFILYPEDIAHIATNWGTAYSGLEDGCFMICSHDTAEYKEIVVNGEYNVDYGWTKGSGWTIPAGVANHNVLGVAGDLTQDLIYDLEAGKKYELNFDVLNYIGGTLEVLVGDPEISLGTYNANGSYTVEIDLSAEALDRTKIIFRAGNTDGYEVDNVSILLKSESYEEDACSECYKLADDWDCTFLIQATNNDDAFGFNYSDVTLVHNLRVKAKLWKPTYPEEDIKHKDSAGNVRVIRFESDKWQTFTIEEVPEYLHDFIRLAFGHDTTLIDTVNYTKDDNAYDPMWRNSSLLAPAEIQVRKNDQDTINSNCS